MRFVWLLGLLGLLLLCCVVLSVNGSAAITVTLPISEPTNITTSLVLGGSLEASTTYYYVMIAYEQEWISPRTGVPHLQLILHIKAFSFIGIIRLNMMQLGLGMRY